MLTLNVLTFLILISASCAEIGQFIVGGEDVGEDEFESTIKLLYESELICGGALLTLELAVTSAQCVVDRATDQFIVEWKKKDLILQFNVNLIKIHPKYQNINGYPVYDVAVLSLDGPTVTTFNIHKKLLKLMDGQVEEGTMGTVVGWGRLSEDGPLAETLQKVELPILSNEQCAEIHGDNYRPDIQFCAGFNDPEVKKDVCIGDFGNVFYVGTSLYGMASWADKPCHVGPKYVAVFTKVISPKLKSS